MDYIKGVDREQTILLPDCVDDYVDENNPVRVIDAYVNGLNMTAMGFTKSSPKDTGRPPYSPKDLLKLYLYGYMNRVRSSRRLEGESKRNLEVIWLLSKLSPDHKTIARFRQENPIALKNVFRDFVRLCVQLDLYGKELLAIDGSKFKACNSKDRAFSEKKLEERIARLEQKIEEYVRQMEELDHKEDSAEGEKASKEIAQIIVALTQRKLDYEGYAQEIRESGDAQKTLTDPDSRLMMNNGKTEVCFNVQTAVDSKHKLIADFDVINNAQDKNQIWPLASQVAQTLDAGVFSVVADAGYDSATDIAQCLMNGLEPHVAGAEFEICIPTEEANAQEVSTYTNGRCVYLRERNIAICPMGKILYPGSYKNRAGVALFYNGRACATCAHKCTVERRKKFQLVMKKRDFKKEYDDHDLWIQQVCLKPNREIVKKRKCIAEHPFGTIKRTLGADHCLMKGLPNVKGEFSLVFLAYNVKRVITILGTRRLLQVLNM